jgi:hypothetical protein
MGRVWVPQTRGRKGVSANLTACPLRTLMEEAWRQDLRAPLPYQWRERAKLLEGRVAAAAAHVGCCVLCCVVLCVVIRARLATILVETLYQQTQNGQFFARSYHKIGPQTPQI